MNEQFPQVKKNLGFGCMRLPMKGKKVDCDEFTRMVDAFIENGFNYFDTAHGYIDGKSEIAIKQCLTSRYDRDKYILTDKLTENYFKSEKDIRPFFESQLEICGVDYFDFYLMHSQNRMNFKKYQACRAYETAFDLKKEGKIRYVGISFHDKAEVLRKILTAYPELDAVQIQFNYYDYNSSIVESKKCYDVCREFNKPIIVMEPVRGGQLVKLPKSAKAIFDSLNGGSAASYAIRYAASFDGIFMVLSGMGNMDMMNDNISYMKDFKPLTQEEHRAVMEVRGILKKQQIVACTNCKYCVSGCPKKISIPDIISCLNCKRSGVGKKDYEKLIARGKSGKASDCIKCGKCEDVCPQKLEIRSILEDAASRYEK